MRSLNDIKKIVKKFNIKPRSEMKAKVLDEALEIQRNRTRQNIPDTNTWRIIMNNKTTKFAAAAMVILAVVFSIMIFDKSTSTAYAIEQTIEANKAVRYLHIKYFDPSYDEPRMMWIEFGKNEDGYKIRAHMPEWTSPGDGPRIVLWKDNKMQIWFEKKNTLEIIEDKTFINRFNMLATEADPRLAVERFYKLHEQKQVEMEITEPSSKAEPIRVTATYLPGSPRAGWRWVLFVDQATNLVTSVEIYRLTNDKYKYEGLLEYYDYNQPIDDKMFVLEKETSELDGQLQAKIEQLDIDTADSEQVKEIFGEPSEYTWGKKRFTEDNLPKRYIMAYTKDFSVYMSENQIVELRHESGSNYVFRDKLRIGSPLEDVFNVIGHPKKIVIGEENQFEDGVLYKNINGTKGFCYYARSDQNVRLWFSGYKINAIYVTRSDLYAP